MVTPAEETAQLKVITARLDKNLAKLRKPINLLANYLDLAEEAIPLSAADFGIQPLRESITSGDVEGVVRNLAVLNRNITRYTDSLTAQGLKPEIVSYFADAATPITDDNKQQHQIISQRQRLVEENIELMNALYATIRRVCKTAKALYKTESPAKVADYTISRLKKEIRRINKQEQAEA